MASHLLFFTMWIHCLNRTSAVTTYHVQDAPVIYSNAGFFPRMMLQIMEPLALLMTVLDAVCWVAGGAFLLGAIGRYMQHRHHPTQAPISQALFLGMIGMALVVLPVIGQYALPGRSSLT